MGKVLLSTLPQKIEHFMPDFSIKSVFLNLTCFILISSQSHLVNLCVEIHL